MALTGNDFFDKIRAMNCLAVRDVTSAVKGKGECILEPKLDGFRLICVVTETGVQMWTRSMKRNDGKCPHIEAELMRLFPAGTVLDGEIMALTVNADGTVSNNFEHVQSVMLSKTDLAVEKNAQWPLQYTVFDMLFDGGVDIRNLALFDRKLLLHKHFEDNDKQPHVMETATFEPTQDTHDALVRMGFEGSVVKQLSSTYHNGKRGPWWTKIKAEWDIDAIVIGFTEGRNSFTGQVGAVRFAQPDPETGELVERGQASGMDFKERRYMTDNADELIGTVITVKHNGVFPGGVNLRHPQFLRMRPDKPATEVIWHDA